jgi:hypothetical protein
MQKFTTGKFHGSSLPNDNAQRAKDAPATQLSILFSNCGPADGIAAAAEKRDFGTSRWAVALQAISITRLAEATASAPVTGNHLYVSSPSFFGTCGAPVRHESRGSVMLRVVAVSLAAVLAGCSSSSRLDGVAPGWANTHTGTVETRRSRTAVRAAPDSAPQSAAPPHAAPSEE